MVFNSFLIWLLSFVFTSAIDALWHLILFKNTYATGIRPMARMNGDKMAFKAFPGLVAQVLVVSCIVVLVLSKAHGGFLEAAFLGAMAGILAISVYGVTNYSLFKDWGLGLTILELVWGPLLGGLSGLFVYWAHSLFKV